MSMSSTAYDETQHPRDPRGQFATKPASEADVQLTVVPGTRHPALDDYEVDDSFPYPQANDLDKVVAVTDLVRGGADTPDAIAHGLDVSGRQGSYYANAAGYLGLVESDRTTGMTTYNLTELGNAFADSDAADRADMMRHMISGMEDVQIVTTDGKAELSRQIQMEDLDPVTADRRASTIAAWADQTGSTQRLELAIVTTTDDCGSRVSEAAQRARAQREEHQRLRSVPERPVAVCGTCHMQLLPSGECGTCW